MWSYVIIWLIGATLTWLFVAGASERPREIEIEE